MSIYLPPEWASAVGEFESWQISAGLPKTTIKTRREHVEHLGRRAPDGPWSLTTEQLVEYLAAQTWAPETRRGRRSTFISFYQFGIEAGHVDVNIARALPRVKPGRATPRPVPESVYESALRRADERMRIVLRLAHDTGLRRGEIARIHSDDFFEDLTGWSLRVHGKGGKIRLVPLTQRLALELRALPDGWAFPGDDGGHLSPRWIGKLATLLLDGPYTLHTLRHSFASRAYGHCRDLAVVQDLLGHSSPATTRVYIVMPNDALRNTVNAIDVA